MLGGVAVLVAVLVLVVALIAGGGAWAPGGILNPGALVGWSLPVVRVLTDLAVIALFGQSLLAVLLPRRAGPAAADTRAALRTAAVAGCAAAVFMALSALLTFAAVVGSGAATALRPDLLPALVHLDASSLLMLSAAFLLAAALAAARASRAAGPDAPLVPLVLAAIALLPVTLTGHATTGGGHLVAIAALAVHLVGVCTWIGGLGALAGYALRHGRVLAVVLPRYSRVAAVCFAAVGLSGVASAAARLTAPAQLVTTDYGRIVLAKTASYLLLGLIALHHRRRLLPAVARATRAGRCGPAAARRAFASLACAEVLVMTATVGLAVALSRTPTPPAPAATTIVDAELGYAMPPPMTAWHLLTLAWYDPVTCTLAVIAVTLYLAGVTRLRHRGERWPHRRTVWWVSGWVTAVLTTCSGLGRYGAITFSGHMVQHMLLSMVAPLPLVLGAPVALARRALDPAPPSCRGPRDWLFAAGHSPAARALGNPWVAIGLTAVSLFGLYCTPLFAALMKGHGGHLVMNVFFLAAGYQFHSTVCAVARPATAEDSRRRLGVVSAAALLHAAFALVLTASTVVIARSWYSGLDVPWVTSLVADQHRAGQLTWVFGEGPLVIALGLLLHRDPVRRAGRSPWGAPSPGRDGAGGA